MSDVDPKVLAEARKRVQDLTAECEATAGQHNIMLGRLFEARGRLQSLENPAPVPVPAPAAEENTTPALEHAPAECAA